MPLLHKHQKPVKLVYSASVASRYEAFVGEHKIKWWTRKKKEALISGDWEEIFAGGKKKFEEKPQGL